MSFTWPAALFLGLVVPLVLGAYLLALRRRRRQAITYSSVALLRTVLPRRSSWLRHLPLALLLPGLALLSVAAARPQVTSDVPVGKTTIVLALDESASMCSTDVSPNRLAAAQKAALQFVKAQPKGVKMGLVLFAGFAQLAVNPTTDRHSLEQVLANLSTGDGTAIGAAILKSLDAIAEADPHVQPIASSVENQAIIDTPPGGAGASGAPSAGKGVRPGAKGYAPDIIVLLTDGSNVTGISPLAAVPYAVARGVRIYTVGLGTRHPQGFACTAAQMGGNSSFGPFAFGGDAHAGHQFSGFGPFGGPGGFNPLVADLPTLRQVSKLTGGHSYSAPSAPQLDHVFATLPRDVTVQKQRHEISTLFAALGGLLLLGTVGAALRWSPYP